MKIIPTEIPDVVLIEPEIYRDERGFFMETWQKKGLLMPVCQSISPRIIIRAATKGFCAVCTISCINPRASWCVWW